MSWKHLLSETNKLDPIEFNPWNCVWASLTTEPNWTHSNGLCSIVWWINSLEQRSFYVVWETPQTHVILRVFQPPKMFYCFSTPVLQKSRVCKSRTRLSSIVQFCVFNFVWLPNSIHGFRLIEIHFKWVWLTKLGILYVHLKSGFSNALVAKSHLTQVYQIICMYTCNFFIKIF